MDDRALAIASEIRRLARKELELALEGDEADLAGSLDSMARLSLVVAVEDRFHVALTEEDAAGLHTLGDLARWLAERVPGEVFP